MIYIQKLLTMPKRERTKQQVTQLISYLRNVKVFKDLLLEQKPDEETANDKAEQDASFINLAASIRVKTINKAGTMLMEEGEASDK